jgi:hypothetical protein
MVAIVYIVLKLVIQVVNVNGKIGVSNNLHDLFLC